MRALVVYESMFGNTKQVAFAIAKGLGARVPVEVTEVAHAPETLRDDVDLVVVGGPTHAFGLSSPRTRRAAAGQSAGPLVSQGKGVREWVSCLHVHRDHTVVATFDTHIDKEWFPGSAAKRLDTTLHAMGMRRLAAPTSFYVHDSAGPLVDGELERAEMLGRRLGEELVARQPSIA
jgi:hypothetical protein